MRETSSRLSLYLTLKMPHKFHGCARQMGRVNRFVCRRSVKDVFACYTGTLLTCGGQELDFGQGAILPSICCGGKQFASIPFHHCKTRQIPVFQDCGAMPDSTLNHRLLDLGWAMQFCEIPKSPFLAVPKPLTEKSAGNPATLA
jgi:hypothetical protein